MVKEFGTEPYHHNFVGTSEMIVCVLRHRSLIRSRFEYVAQYWNCPASGIGFSASLLGPLPVVLGVFLNIKKAIGRSASVQRWGVVATEA